MKWYGSYQSRVEHEMEWRRILVDIDIGVINQITKASKITTAGIIRCLVYLKLPEELLIEVIMLRRVLVIMPDDSL